MTEEEIEQHVERFAAFLMEHCSCVVILCETANGCNGAVNNFCMTRGNANACRGLVEYWRDGEVYEVTRGDNG